MRHIPLAIGLAATLALPSTASAAQVKIGPRVDAVAPSGAVAIEVANPTRRALAGRATLTVDRRTVASRAVRLPRRAVRTITLRLSKGALSALREAGTQRAVAVVRLKRGRGAVTARRTVTLRAPGTTAPAPTPAAPAPGPGAPVATPGPGTPAAPAPAPSTPAPGPANRWAGRMGTEGAFDDLELTVDGGRMTITKAPAVPVLCTETTGGSDSWTSGELFDAPGPWTIGTDESVEKPGIRVNPLVGRSERTVTYKVTESRQVAGRITGTLGMIFYAARPHVFYGNMVIVSCFGSQSFEAVPAS